jgi:adenylate cyclase
VKTFIGYIAAFLTLMFANGCSNSGQDAINGAKDNNTVALSDSHIDSLWGVFHSKNSEDEDKLLALHDLFVFNAVPFHTDTFDYYGNIELDLARKLKLPEEEAMAWNNIAVGNCLNGEIQGAELLFLKADSLLEIADNVDVRLMLFLNRSEAAIFMGDLDKSLELAQKGLELSIQNNNVRLKGAFQSNIASVYVAHGDLFKALQFYNQAQENFERSGEKIWLSVCLGSMAKCYMNVDENSQEAIDHLERAIEINTALGESSYIFSQIADLASIHLNNDRSQEGLDLINEGMGFAVEDNNLIAMSNFSNVLGKHYLDNNSLESATFHFSKGAEWAEQSSYNKGIVANTMQLAKISMNQGNREESMTLYKQALSIANSLEHKQQIHHDLYKLYSLDNMTDQSLKMLEMSNSLLDSLEAKSKLREIIKSTYQKEAIKDSIAAADQAIIQESLLLAEQAENKQITQRSYFLYAGLLLTILFGAVIFNRFRITRSQKIIIEKEKERSEELLLNILPEEIAEELKSKGSADAQLIDLVTVLFTDFKGFTALSEILSPEDLVREINECFSAFDHIMEKYNIEKIKTIGDAYMAAGGLPTTNETHAIDVVRAAIDIQTFMLKHAEEKKANNEPFFEIRIGVHTGSVVAGIVGVKKFQYDIWGDTVNTASRMESSGKVGKVNISESTYEIVRAYEGYSFESRGKIEAKGKGVLEMYFVQKN